MSDLQMQLLQVMAFGTTAVVAFMAGRDWDEIAGATRRTFARRRRERQLRREYRREYRARRRFCRTPKRKPYDRHWGPAQPMKPLPEPLFPDSFAEFASAMGKVGEAMKK